MKIQVQIDKKDYFVEINDIHARPIIAIVDGESFEVWPKENEKAKISEKPMQLAQVPESPSGVIPMTASKIDRKVTNVIKAPLPGVIVSIEVKPGESVKHGQELCTLEAMKMKNIIRSTRDGAIKEILISVGDQVQHDQILFALKA
ncbi:MAG: biotin/lipoyl-containing protein [Chloroflexota bacterium]